MRVSLFKRGGGTAVDPVCGMDVDAGDPPGGEWRHEGVSYYFCGPGCNRAFQKEPEAYLSGDKRIEM